MAVTKLVVPLICLISVATVAQEHKGKPEAKVTQLMSKDLPDLPGKEGLMLIVDYPPGSSDPIHRYNAPRFATYSRARL
jgi:hypothetical protein